jgi:hypothetical protein
MAGNTLKKVNGRIKAIKKAHPNMSHATARDQAWREYRAGAKVGKKKSARKVGKKAKPKRRKAVGSHYEVSHVVRKVGKLRYTGKAYKIGALTIPQARAQVREKKAWELLAKDSAKTAGAKRAAAKKVKALTKLQKQLDSI